MLDDCGRMVQSSVFHWRDPLDTDLPLQGWHVSLNLCFVFAPVQVPLGVSSQRGKGEDCTSISGRAGFDSALSTASGEHWCACVHEMGLAWESRLG